MTNTKNTANTFDSYTFKIWEVYESARKSAEAGRVHPRTLARNGGTAESYAEYHARRFARDIFRTELEADLLEKFRARYGAA